jgi:histidinol dehydrogenase
MTAKITKEVSKIISDIAKGGDKAALGYIYKFDGIKISAKMLKIPAESIENSSKNLSKDIKNAIKTSFDNVKKYHKREYENIKKTWKMNTQDFCIGQSLNPIYSVGIYVPGGLFSYPSTVIMTAVAARTAGVKKIIIATPPKKINSALLYAAKLCGIKDIYTIGGAGAIAALAFGTETIPAADMIVGPGNMYVNEAKRQVFGRVGIDSLAGPSEVSIIADRDAPSDFIVADILAQTEHDRAARAFLFCESKTLIEEVKNKIRRIAGQEIFKQIEIKQVSIEKGIEFSNEIAPEHLELLIKNYSKYIKYIKNAGAIFAGYQTPTAAGDYLAGPSHVLPTARSARFASGLSVQTFLKRTSFIEMKDKNNAAYKKIADFAESEGLAWHKKSALTRLDLGKNGNALKVSHSD